jgi:hypothetical protein
MSTHVSKDVLLVEFNDICLKFIEQIACICPDSVIANNTDIIRRIIHTTPVKIIDIFVLYILKYKPHIDARNEQFFLEGMFADDTHDDNDIITKIFEFKTLWRTLSDNNKDVVIQYMQILCQLALEYIS